MIDVRCAFCQWTGQVMGSETAVRRWVSGQVGHPMPSLAIAVGHICCPGCDQTTLRLRKKVVA